MWGADFPAGDRPGGHPVSLSDPASLTPTPNEGTGHINETILGVSIPTEVPAEGSQHPTEQKNLPHEPSQPVTRHNESELTHAAKFWDSLLCSSRNRDVV